METNENINKFLETVLGSSKPWYIEELTQTKEEITITLQYPKKTIYTYPKCGKQCTIYDHRWRTFRHLDWWQYKTTIKIKTPKNTMLPKNPAQK